MKIKCDYCRSYINDYDEKCPHCGAINTHLVRNANEAPKTIEELQQWYKDRNLPDENTTRFFIGKNHEGPRAFGIYKDDVSGNFIVYKNKSDGSRAIRYKGKDEAYAVNELYMKLKEEILNQKSHNSNQSNNKKKLKINLFTIYVISLILVTFIIILVSIIASLGPNRGYYHYHSNYYYYQSGSWYVYDDYYGEWTSTEAPRTLRDNYSDYYDSSYYDSNYDIDRFEDSSYYVEPSSSSDSSWDSSSDWDSGSSWDSGSTDWSSDW